MKSVIFRNLAVLRRNKLLSVAFCVILATFLIYLLGHALKKYQTDHYYRLVLNARDKAIERIEQYHKNNKKGQRLPDVIGIGVKKCGTDGIISFLSQHPLVAIPKDVETFFFSHQYNKPISVYRNLMPSASNIQVVMEKTPVYFDHFPHDMPERIKEAIPHVKLILVVCDPVARAYSDYVHERVRHDLYGSKMMSKYDTFEKYLDVYLPILKHKTRDWSSSGLAQVGNELTSLHQNNLDATVLSTGLYAAHIQRWKRVFNGLDLKVVDGNRFMREPGLVIKELQQFIGLPKLLLPEDFVKHPDTGYYCYRRFELRHLHNETLSNREELLRSLKCLAKSKGRTRNGLMKMSETAKKELREFYEPFNRLFYEEMGTDYKW